MKCETFCEIKEETLTHYSFGGRITSFYANNILVGKLHFSSLLLFSSFRLSKVTQISKYELTPEIFCQQKYYNKKIQDPRDILLFLHILRKIGMPIFKAISDVEI